MMGIIREPDGVDFVIGPSRIDARGMALLGAWIRARKRGTKPTVEYALEPELKAGEFLSVVDDMLHAEPPSVIDREDAMATMREADVIATARIDGSLVAAMWIGLDRDTGTQPPQFILDPMFAEQGIEAELIRLVATRPETHGA